MKPKDNLFALIHTMSSSEKRAFRLFAKQNANGKASNYLKLFRAIDEQKEYNEAAIKEKFAGEKFVVQLTVTKHYLYNLILKSLRQHQDQLSVDEEINVLWRNAVMLLVRQLFDQAYQMAIKAKELAYRYESFSHLIPILQIEAHAVSEMGDPERIRTLGVIDECSDVIALMKEQTTYRRTLIEASVLHQQLGRDRLTELKPKFQNMLGGEVLGGEVPVSLLAQIDRLNARSYCQMSLWESYEAYNSIQEAIELFQGNEHFTAEYPEEYMMLLTNLMGMQMRLKQFEQARNVLEEMKRVPSKTPLQQERFMYLTVIRECDLFLRCEQIPTPDLGELGNRVQTIIDCHLPSPDQIFYLESMMSWCYFMAENYDKALELFWRVLNRPVVEVRQDIYTNIRLGLAMVHFELGNFDAMESSVVSAYRYIRKRGSFSEQEQLVIKYLRKLATTGSGFKDPELFQEAYHKIIRAHKKLVLETFIAYPALSWFGAKAEGQPIRRFYTHHPDALALTAVVS